jgi:hypothetical protein
MEMKKKLPRANFRRRRCDSNSSRRQCGGRRNYCERPRLVQSGHDYRRIFARRQKIRRRSFCRHAKSHRRFGNQSQPRRNRHDARPRARTHHRGGKNQIADPENRGSIHGLLHAASAGHRRAGLGVHARFDARHRRVRRLVSRAHLFWRRRPRWSPRFPPPRVWEF